MQPLVPDSGMAQNVGLMRQLQHSPRLGATFFFSPSITTEQPAMRAIFRPKPSYRRPVGVLRSVRRLATVSDGNKYATSPARRKGIPPKY